MNILLRYPRRVRSGVVKPVDSCITEITAEHSLGRQNGIEAILQYLQTKSVWCELSEEVQDPFVLKTLDGIQSIRCPAYKPKCVRECGSGSHVFGASPHRLPRRAPVRRAGTPRHSQSATAP